MTTRPGFLCPECKAPLEGVSGTSAYKHAINCLHLNPGTPAMMVDQAKKESSERGHRAAIMLGVEEQ